jgi:hypothetical protein
MTDRRHRQSRRDDMKLAVIAAIALAVFAAADSASAGARRYAGQGQHVGIGKGVAGGSLTSIKTAGPRALGRVGAGQAANSQGIIMRDGGVCDPIRHMGC